MNEFVIYSPSWPAGRSGRAVPRLAATLEKTFDSAPALIEGRGGVFEIRLDDELVFSKRSLGRFPDSEEEVVDALRAAAG